MLVASPIQAAVIMTWDSKCEQLGTKDGIQSVRMAEIVDFDWMVGCKPRRSDRVCYWAMKGTMPKDHRDEYRTSILHRVDSVHVRFVRRDVRERTIRWSESEFCSKCDKHLIPRDIFGDCRLCAARALLQRK